MRVSLALLVFLILLNGWAAILQQYDIDDHVGITAETGDPEQIEEAKREADNFETGSEIGGTLLGMYNALGNAVESMFVGIQPGGKMLVNLAPPGIAEDLIMWGYSIVELILGIDLIRLWRSGDI